MKKDIFFGKKAAFFGLFFALLPALAFSQTSFSRGEAIFMENKPAEALTYLEAAVSEDPAHVKAFLYLGIAYQQLNRLDDAVAVYQRILPRGGTETARIAFNLGNVYFTQGSHSQAAQSYTRALEADPLFATAFLNRANAEIQQGLLNEAIADYEKYLSMEPGSAQRGKIEQLVMFIRAEFAAEEQRRLIAEETARLEAERRQRLLDEVSASLQAAAEDSKGLSAGNEEIQGYEGEFVLE